MAKDQWDKLEIIAKAIGAIVIPGAVGFAVYSYNVEASSRATSSAMTSVAIGVLTQKLDTENAPLRDWAVSVLQHPQNPPPLSDEAANALRQGAYFNIKPWLYWGTSFDKALCEVLGLSSDECDRIGNQDKFVVDPDGLEKPR